MEDKYYKLYDELIKIVEEIRVYYDVDKIKPYSVYIWAKEDKNNLDNWGNNIFDIYHDAIIFYDEGHEIIKETLPIIDRIQSKLKEIRIEGKRLKGSGE